MTTQTALTYTRSLTTECKNKLKITEYLRELLGYLVARSSGTSKVVKHESFGQAICYDDSSQEPFVQVESISYLQEAFSSLQVSERNLQTIKFLDEWFAQPDDLGDEVWDEFEKELKANRFTI